MKIIQKTLVSGLRLIMAPQPDAATATVLILVGAGSKYETKKENGLSHFLEHMYFKGTALRPTAQIISETLDNLRDVPRLVDLQSLDRSVSRDSNSKIRVDLAKISHFVARG